MTFGDRVGSVTRVKKLGLLLSGSILIALFLAWMLLKGTETVRSWTDAHDLLGPAALGLAWLCLLGGCALIVRAVYRRPPSADATSD